MRPTRLLAFLLVALVNGPALAQESVSEARRTHADLLLFVNGLHSDAKDFLEMANARKGDPEFELLMYLHNTAQSTSERLSADYTLIAMFDDIQCREDKIRVRHYISQQFGYDSRKQSILISRL